MRLVALQPENQFMLITDPGRVGKMRKTTRRVQRINYIPSKFGPDPYRQEIKALIEDPLPKDSAESYFIQLADLVAQITYYWVLLESGVGRLPGRMPPAVDFNLLREWLEILKPSLNLKASGANPFGIVTYPK